MKKQVHHFYPDNVYLFRVDDYHVKEYYISETNDNETYIVANGVKYPLEYSEKYGMFFVDNEGYVIHSALCELE